MSWNNIIMEKKFQEEQAELRKYYEANGMTEEQIKAMYDYDREVFLNERNRCEAGETVSLDDEDNEPLKVEADLSAATEDTYFSDDVLYGFQDERLNRIARRTYDFGRRVMKWLMLGYSQREIAQQMGVSQSKISRTIRNFAELAN